VIIEEDMTIPLANAGFERLSGYSKEELEGSKKWPDFVACEDDLSKMKEYHRLRRIDPGKAPRSYEFRFIDRHGNVKDMLVTTNMIPRTRKSVASLLDITERKRAEEEREKLILELQEALATIKTLSGVIPICAWCGRKIRDEEGHWVRLEVYITERSEAEFSHGMCPDCAQKLDTGE
jgi:PAS domain S-box-containing protein